MKARTRLTIWVVCTAIIFSTGIGFFSLYSARNSEYAAIDRKVEIVFRDIMMSQTEPLSAALYSIQSHKYDFALIVTPESAPPVEVLSSSTGDGAGDVFRRYNLALANGDVITIAAPTGDIESSFRSNSLQLGGFIAVLNVLYIVLGFFYVRGVSRREDRLALARMQSFIGDASHELRTPLTVIKGYSEMLAHPHMVAGDDRARAHARMKSEIARMENIIADLLLLAELGEMREITLSKLNLGDLLSAHAHDFSTLHPHRKVDVNVQSVEIEGDVEHLNRLITNALGNIARHTPVSAPVRISLQGTPKKSLIIEDGGPGLPDDMYGKAAIKFQRFDKSRSRDKGGSGLGISIMQAIAAEHKATFEMRKSSLGGVALEIIFP